MTSVRLSTSVPNSVWLLNGRWIFLRTIILLLSRTVRSGSTGWHSLRCDTFFGLHLLGGQFNVGNVDFPLGIYPSTKGYRYEGYYYGAGLAYGYQWLLGKRWSIEAGIGVGYVQNHYDKYDCPKCGEWKEKNDKGYFSVTKAAVSLIYTIK